MDPVIHSQHSRVSPISANRCQQHTPCLRFDNLDLRTRFSIRVSVWFENIESQKRILGFFGFGETTRSSRSTATPTDCSALCFCINGLLVNLGNFDWKTLSDSTVPQSEGLGVPSNLFFHFVNRRNAESERQYNR